MLLPFNVIIPEFVHENCPGCAVVELVDASAIVTGTASEELKYRCVQRL
jgi:hypothetical protein